jgi:hypothetical protein
MSRKMDAAMAAPARVAATLTLTRSDAPAPDELIVQLQAIIATMTDPNPKERPATAAEVAGMLAAMAEARDGASAAVRE